MKEDGYTKKRAKNQVCAMIHVPDIRKNFLTKFRERSFITSPGGFQKSVVYENCTPLK